VLGKDGKVAINNKEAAEALDWYLDLFRKHKVTPPSVPTDGWRASSRLRPRRHQLYIQLRLLGGAEDFVKPENFATVPLPFGPARSATRSTSRDADAVQGRQGARRRLQIHGVAMEPEPHFMYSKTLGLLPARKTVAERPEFTRIRRWPASSSRSRSRSSARTSPRGWAASSTPRACRSSSRRSSASSRREFLDKFAEVLSKNSRSRHGRKRPSRGRWRGRSCRARRELLTAIATAARGDRARATSSSDRARDPDEPLPQRPDQAAGVRLHRTRQLRRLLDDEVFWLTLWNSFYWVFGSVAQFLGGFAAACSFIRPSTAGPRCAR